MPRTLVYKSGSPTLLVAVLAACCLASACAAGPQGAREAGLKIEAEARMEPRVHIITLAVADLPAARAFYERLGWKASAASQETIAFFQLGDLVLALYPRQDLADDVGVDSKGDGFQGFTLAHNVPQKDQVAAILDLAEQAGGRIVKPARDVAWGGHSGYFADPDGHFWEVAWNPFFPFSPSGSLCLP